MQGGLISSNLDFRMGLNLGDIVISASVFEQVRNRIEADYADMGEQ